jgi:hypothetical protein
MFISRNYNLVHKRNSVYLNIKGEATLETKVRIAQQVIQENINID